MEHPTTAAPTESAAQPSPVALEVHDFAAIFPPMREPEFAALVADIRERGQLEPIWTYQGKVIDGRHRLRACTELGLTPRTREWDGSGSLLEFVISANLRRRHLKENQRAMVAARMLPHYEAEARDRQRTYVDGVLRANWPEARSREEAGKTLSVSGRSVQRARKLLDCGIPELIAHVDAGTLAVSLASKIAELPSDEQAVLVKLSRAEIVVKLRASHPKRTKPKSPAAIKEDEKIARMIQNTQIGPGAQLLNTPQGLRLELTYADCLTEFYRLNSDRYHLLDLLERGVFIVRKPYQQAV